MRRPDSHEFITAARTGRNNWTLYLGTILLVIAAIIAGNIPLGIAMMMPTMTTGEGPDPETLQGIQDGGFNPEAWGISPSIGLLLAVIPFAFGLFALMLCVNGLHKRPWQTMLNPLRSMNWKKVLFAAGLWFVFSGLLEVVGYLMRPDTYEFTFDAGAFFPVLIVALLFLPLQTTFEEFLFRSYLMQGISLAARRTWVALLITSALFGLMHIMNPEVGEFGAFSMVYYIGVGLFLG